MMIYTKVKSSPRKDKKRVTVKSIREKQANSKGEYKPAPIFAPRGQHTLI